MKKHGRGVNKLVMFGLLAVLLISLGYLSMQGKEGFKRKNMEGMEMPGDMEMAEDEEITEGMEMAEGVEMEEDTEEDM